MIILLIFSFLAGIATVLSPCVIPILPALLSASTAQGRLRPFGIISGLVLSFAFFTLFLTALVHLLPISADGLRYLAVLLIGSFGLILLFPRLSDTFAKWTGGVGAFGQTLEAKARTISSGFGSGFVLGVALGIVWTPCAGPILAAITTLVAVASITWQAILLTAAYALGAAIPLLLIALGAHALLSVKWLARHAEAIRQLFGGLMLVSAVAIATHWDVRLQQIAIEYFPMLTIEDQPIVRKELAKLRPPSAFAKTLEEKSAEAAPGILPELAPAPEIAGISAWLNSPPLSLQNLRGKVVLIDFWTYSCINCIRTFPYLTRWYDDYKDKGFIVIGVHTPEFEFEKNLRNVEEATKRFHIRYPVALDNDYQTWQNFGNHYWPAHYLIDQQGIVRHYHFGEGAYIETENAIRHLLGLQPIQAAEKEVRVRRNMTQETYLGYMRAEAYVQEIHIKPNAVENYAYTSLPRNAVGLKGRWRIESERATSQSNTSSLDLNFLANRVYLVMDAEKPQKIQVLLDDKPLATPYQTADTGASGEILVKEARKYDILNLQGDPNRHKLTLIVPEGVSLYAFTFGDEP